MKPRIEDVKAGIYVIKNLINNKIYVGKSKNIYKRMHQHLYDVKTESRNNNENCHLLNSIKKYGLDNFDYYIVESFDENLENLEELLYDSELFWMNELDCLNPEIGYNLRYDFDSKCFVSDKTRQKISNRVKFEWETGIRDEHSNKMKDYWKDNNERKLEQSKIMSKNKTKYRYIIYDPQGELLTEQGNYTTLKELGLTNSSTQFSRKNSNEIYCKKYKVIRKLINEDIVQSSEKSEIN